MKKFSLIAVIFAAAFVLTGCFSTNTSQESKGAAFEIKPVKYEMDIETRKTAVSGEAAVNCLFGIFTWGVSDYADYAFSDKAGIFSFVPNPNDVAKKGATYNACKKANADMLIGAKYVIETEDYFVFKRIKCTTTGYPGVVKGIK